MNDATNGNGTYSADSTRRETQPAPRLGAAVAGLAALGWAVMVVAYLRPPIALSPDSMNNYAHVWWIAQHLWRDGTIPWHMPVIGHGDAITFPYGAVNWTFAALLRPLGVDRATGVVTVIGALGSIVATFVAFPELRRGWFAAAVLVEVPLVRMLLLGQQSFAWAAMFGLLGIAAWRRERWLLAAVLVAVAQANHAAVVLPIGVLGVTVALVVRPERARIARWYALALALSVPAVFAVLSTPAYADSSTRDRVVNFFSAIGPRILVVALPLAFVALGRRYGGRGAVVAFLLSVVVHGALYSPLEERMGWRTFSRVPATAAAEEYVRSSAFRAGATVRFLRGSDSKLGRYIALRAGARLDSEFFPESEAIRSFRSIAAYETLLCERHVDSVVVFGSYDSTRRTNEHALLRRIAAGGADRISVHLVDEGPSFDAYAVVRTGC